MGWWRGGGGAVKPCRSQHSNFHHERKEHTVMKNEPVSAEGEAATGMKGAVKGGKKMPLVPASGFEAAEVRSLLKIDSV